MASCDRPAESAAQVARQSAYFILFQCGLRRLDRTAARAAGGLARLVVESCEVYLRGARRYGIVIDNNAARSPGLGHSGRGIRRQRTAGDIE